MMLKLIHVIIASCLVLLLSSCMMAGGTAGTGLQYGGSNVQRYNTGVSYANVTGIVYDQRGKAAQFLSVSASTSRNEETSNTDAVGSFGIFIIMKQQEEVLFTITNAQGKTWKGTYRGESFADGDSLSIRLGSGGRAEIEMF